jgi:quercetin dioxygenase-like cupin family protein
MQVIHPEEIEAKPVVTEGAEKTTIRQLITAETGAPTFAMRLFEVEPGGHTPLHDHDWEHEVFILEGVGELRGPNASHTFIAGDAVFVRPGETHQFVNTGGDVLRFLCMIPVGDASCR